MSGLIDRAGPPAPGPLRPFHFPEVEHLRLSNGIPLLVASLHRLPVVTVSVLLRAGGVHEERESAGLATLTGTLLESGAGDRSAGEIAEALEGLGVQVETGTSWDVTHLDLTTLSARLGAATEVMVDLIRRPTFPPEEVERLRGEQLAGILQRRADPRSLANEMAARFIFSDATPFSRSLSGSAETVQDLSRADVAAFHAERFSPAAAAILVAGDITAEAARELAEQGFGDWTGGAAPTAAVDVRPRSTRREIVIVDRPGSVQSEVRVGQVGVARSTPDYFPIVVMNTMLGGAFSSRLNLNLRERHGFTYGVSSSFVMRREPGPFLISTAVQTEVTARAVTEILREVEAIRQEPASGRELDDARNYAAGTFPLRLQTTDGVASRLAELVVHDLPRDYFDSYRERILAVGAEDALRAARDHVDPDSLSIVIVGDAAAIREPLEALGLGQVRVHENGSAE